MLFDELFALHEHAGRAAARIVDAPLVRREPLDQHADHATRRVELPAILPLRTGELREEVFVDAAQEIRKSFERFSASPSAIVPITSISSPKRCLSSAGRPKRKTFGKIPLSRGLSRSMATIASSISLPMVGCLALSCSVCQRASAGTQ